MAKILIVDDEAHVRFTLAEVLGDAGHQVIAASSGAEALALADDELDAVISDLSMPGMDGLALLTALRQRDASLPVLLLTARGSERVAVQAMKAGAYDYLVKPFDIDEIVHALARAVEARLLRRQHRRQLAERGLERPIVGEAPALRRVLDLAARMKRGPERGRRGARRRIDAWECRRSYRTGGTGQRGERPVSIRWPLLPILWRLPLLIRLQSFPSVSLLALPPLDPREAMARRRQ
jgi:CheY-like chemotaxis protein